MSYKEGKNLTNIISVILITLIYGLIIYNKYNAGTIDSTNIFRFWAIVILIYIPISIATRIVILIVFNIISAVVQTAKGEEVETDEVIDERDKMIELKVTKISLIIFSFGFIFAFLTQIFNMSNHMFFLTFILFGVLSEIASDLLSIFYYKRGF